MTNYSGYYNADANNPYHQDGGYYDGHDQYRDDYYDGQGGGYYDDQFNGSYIGFVGGDKPQYVIVVRVNEPKIGGYAGSKAAAPLFSDIATFLIGNFNVTPKSS